MSKFNTSVEICGIKFKNPVILASGTAGFGEELGEFFNIELLGGLATKGVTLEERAGNAPPRIAETPGGMLNAVGLQNPGVEVFLQQHLPRLKQRGIPVIVNIAGKTVEEYAMLARRMDRPDVDMVELNISCPNVKEGGVAFGAYPERIMEVVRAVRTQLTRPLMVKLSPNTASIAESAQAAEQGGADAVSLINTLTGMMVDVYKKRPILANITGGLSGPAVLPVALRMVYEASRAVSIPCVGMGGIISGEDAIAFLLCGARAVMVGTASILDPCAAVRIIEEIEIYMEKTQTINIEELISALKTD